jgi:hypothetical protein
MNPLKQYFSLKTMVSFWLITIAYAVGVLAIIVWSINLMLQGGINSIAGILLVVFGNLFWRVFCELAIVLFHIEKALKKAEQHLKVLSDTVKHRQ